MSTILLQSSTEAPLGTSYVHVNVVNDSTYASSQAPELKPAKPQLADAAGGRPLPALLASAGTSSQYTPHALKQPKLHRSRRIYGQKPAAAGSTGLAEPGSEVRPDAQSALREETAPEGEDEEDDESSTVMGSEDARELGDVDDKADTKPQGKAMGGDEVGQLWSEANMTKLHPEQEDSRAAMVIMIGRMMRKPSVMVPVLVVLAYCCLRLVGWF